MHQMEGGVFNLPGCQRLSEFVSGCAQRDVNWLASSAHLANTHLPKHPPCSWPCWHAVHCKAKAQVRHWPAPNWPALNGRTCQAMEVVGTACDPTRVQTSTAHIPYRLAVCCPRPSHIGSGSTCCCSMAAVRHHAPLKLAACQGMHNWCRVQLTFKRQVPTAHDPVHYLTHTHVWRALIQVLSSAHHCRHLVIHVYTFTVAMHSVPH